MTFEVFSISREEFCGSSWTRLTSEEVVSSTPSFIPSVRGRISLKNKYFEAHVMKGEIVSMLKIVIADERDSPKILTER